MGKTQKYTSTDTMRAEPVTAYGDCLEQFTAADPVAPSADRPPRSVTMVPIEAIEANPYRTERFVLQEDKIEALLQSYDATIDWKRPSGRA